MQPDAPSPETTSPFRRVHRAINCWGVVLVVRNRTDPSAKANWTPPVCMLPA